MDKWRRVPASNQEQKEERKRFCHGLARCRGGGVCRDLRHYPCRCCRRLAYFTSRRNGNAGLDTARISLSRRDQCRRIRDGRIIDAVLRGCGDRWQFQIVRRVRAKLLSPIASLLDWLAVASGSFVVPWPSLTSPLPFALPSLGPPSRPSLPSSSSLLSDEELLDEVSSLLSSLWASSSIRCCGWRTLSLSRSGPFRRRRRLRRSRQAARCSGHRRPGCRGFRSLILTGFRHAIASR